MIIDGEAPKSRLESSTFRTWLESRLESIGMDVLYAPHVISMIDEKHDFADYIRNVAGESEAVLALISELRLLVSNQSGEYAGGELPDRRSSSMSIFNEPEAAAPPRRRAVDDYNDIFHNTLSFDLSGLSANAKEFKPGSAGSDGPILGAGTEASGAEDEGPDPYYYYTGLEGGGDQQQQQLMYQMAEGALEATMDPSGEYYFPDENMHGGEEGVEESDVYEDELYDEMYSEQGLEPEMLYILQANFPDCSIVCLQLALQKAEWDIEAACRMVQGALQRASDKNQKPCRHFLAGECLRRDCMFSHDFATTVCRYWLQGICHSADRCVFVHDVSLEDADIPGNADTTSQDGNSLIEGLKGMDIGNDNNMGSDFPTLELDSEFPALSGSMSGSGGRGINARKDSGESRSFASVAATIPDPSVKYSTTSNGNSNINAAGLHVLGGANRRPTEAARSAGMIISGNGWIHTGEAVAGHYQQARSDAAELAKSRNSCFVEATQAYCRGDAKAARDLAQRGRELNEAMKERHRVAARSIFKSRNTRQQVMERRLLDLHGLHVGEVTVILEEELPQLCQAGLRTVCLVTGSGHHSKGSSYKARLLPAVERLCQDWGLPYERVADKNGHVGMLYVTLSQDAFAYDGAVQYGDTHAAAATTEPQRRTITIR